MTAPKGFKPRQLPSYRVACLTQTWNAVSGGDPYYVVKGGNPTSDQTTTECGKFVSSPTVSPVPFDTPGSGPVVSV